MVDASANLLATFEVRCYRSFGENWQRKSWYAGAYYWRSRYDKTLDSLVFEYISETDIASNVWTENTNARIDASSFTNPFNLSGDFAVILPHAAAGITTIVYSDGVDIWVAESDEASATGWAWENTTKVADETSPDWYRYVNINHDLRAATNRFYISAVYYQNTGGTYHVRMWRQSAAGNITGWDAPEDVSNIANTNRILGQASRHVGDMGTARYDMIFVYKEGVAIRSRFWDGTPSGGSWETIQDIDTTASFDEVWLAEFDIEHSELAGAHTIHIVYIDADGSVISSERGPADTDVWGEFETVDTSSSEHHYVALARAGVDWMYVLWQEGGDEIGWRIHIHDPGELWVPSLASAYYEFHVSIAIDPTTSLSQILTPDEVPAGEPMPISWSGAESGVCGIGWGLLRHATHEDLFSKFVVAQGSTDFKAEFVTRFTATKELFSEFIVRQTGTVDLFSELIVRQTGTVDLFSELIVRQTGTKDLFSVFVVGQGSADLKAIFLLRQETEDLFAEFELQSLIDLKALALISGLGYVVKGGTPF